MPRSIAAVALFLLVGCDSCEPASAPDPGATPAQGAETPADTPAPEAPPSTEERTRASVAIGWDAIPEPPDATNEANRAALRLHRAGDYAESRAAFQRIVDAHPRRDLVRFNLACALSRIRDHARAADELETLLSRDLATYAQKLSDDEDLAPFRASSEMARIERHIDALRPAYRAAAQAGVPMVTLRTSTLRGGVWLPNARRFVPLGPRINGAESVLIDPELDAAITVTSREDEECDSEGCVITRLVRHGLLGGPATVDIEVSAIDVAFHALESGGIRFRGDPGGMSAPVYGQRWEEIAPGADAPTVSASRDAPPRPFVMSGQRHDALFTRPSYAERRWPNGYRVRHNSLEADDVEPIALSSGHAITHRFQSLAVSGDHAIVASSDGCRHLVDRVDLKEREVVETVRGDGPAAVRVDGDGRVWLQINDTVRPVPDLSASFDDGGEPILDGVVLDPMRCGHP